MNVYSIGTYSKQANLSSANKFGNVPLPDYDRFHTKASPIINEDEYKELIVSQAYRDHAAGITSAGNSLSTMSLLKSYCSVVAPNRKDIISDGLQIILNEKNDTYTGPPSHSLIEFLYGYCNYRKYNNVLNSAEFFDENGELVATYVQNSGWHCISTKAEDERVREFYSIYLGAMPDTIIRRYLCVNSESDGYDISIDINA